MTVSPGDDDAAHQEEDHGAEPDRRPRNSSSQVRTPWCHRDRVRPPVPGAANPPTRTSTQHLPPSSPVLRPKRAGRIWQRQGRRPAPNDTHRPVGGPPRPARNEPGDVNCGGWNAPKKLPRSPPNKPTSRRSGPLTRHISNHRSRPRCPGRRGGRSGRCCYWPRVSRCSARPGLLAVSADLALVLALLFIVGGVTLLLTGIWQRRHSQDAEGDDGAVV